jgi:predicted nuclease of restriction endonuclease-like (RecB) superfamily
VLLQKKKQLSVNEYTRSSVFRSSGLTKSVEPVWSHGGIICTGESYKNVVKLTFSKGASLKDPARLFNSSLDGNVRRAIDIHGIVQTVSAQLVGALAKECAARFPLPWSHYVRLLAVRSAHARAFYESEALRGGWTIRQLDRQIQTQFYERTARSRDKAALLGESDQSHVGDSLTPDEEIKDPYVLEFIGLRDDYSESQLEDALLGKLQVFLLELGGDFTFVGRQHRLRVGNEWYRVDLLFFHRRLRCLVIIDHKLGKLTHADAGQMHLYLNYAREHWVLPGEPVGWRISSTDGYRTRSGHS